MKKLKGTLLFGKVKTRKLQFGPQKKLHGNLWKSGSLGYNKLSNNLPKQTECDFLAKKIRKGMTLVNIKRVELHNLDDHRCLKFQKSFDPKGKEEMWTPSVKSYFSRPKTFIQCAERTAKFF